jgi:hypothetical protein
MRSAATLDSAVKSNGDAPAQMSRHLCGVRPTYLGEIEREAFSRSLGSVLGCRVLGTAAGDSVELSLVQFVIKRLCDLARIKVTHGVLLWEIARAAHAIIASPGL